MSVPLDNLYHWINGLLSAPAILYVFQPHGSKKISDLVWLTSYNYDSTYKLPSAILHDQEPLDWNSYNCPEEYINLDRWKKLNNLEIDNLRFEYSCNFNLKSMILALSSCMYDRDILIHSEKNSEDLIKYQQNGFVGVHYWAHAVIARDWYRFAQFDTRLDAGTQPSHKFLIYCRDWSHRREYRLKFLEMLVENNLEQDSLTSVMHTNSDNVHFSQHRFSNPKFELANTESISQIKNNTFSSATSADYDYSDFIDTEISVVLETVFDDSRIHLTEKTLRPIACGHPFLLAAGPGSLEYIRSYGFKTFSPWIDESYDLETDSVKRLEKIISSMKQIQQLPGQEFEDFLQAVKIIADYNKKHFFSDQFFDTLKSELKNNLDQAWKSVAQSRGKHYLELMRSIRRQNLMHQVPFRREKTQFIRQLRQSYPVDRSNPQEDPAV